MGQVFFSLSLGLGITITYGSYLKRDSDVYKRQVKEEDAGPTNHWKDPKEMHAMLTLSLIHI